MRGVTFGDIHTYRDFGLYPKSRPVVSPPEPKLHYVDIPGADGSIDLTQALTGRVAYSDREINMEFVVINGRERWSHVYSQLLNILHGREMQIILDDDPQFYYIGRPVVDEMESDKKTATIAIKATVQPYKYAVNGTTDDWLWDATDFENGIIYDYEDIPVDGEVTLPIVVQGLPGNPVFTASADMTLTVDGSTYQLPQGTSKPLLDLAYGTHLLTITGNGNIRVDYKEVSL